MIDRVAEYFRTKWFNYKVQRFIANLPPDDVRTQEEKWRSAEIPPEWLTPTILTGIEKSAQYCVKIIQPSILLLNICGVWHSREKKPTGSYAGVLGGYGDYGGENADVGFDYSPLKINQLFLVAFHQFEEHLGVCEARRRLERAGIKTHWASTSYNAASELNLCYDIDHASVAAIKQLAKEDWGVKTKSQSDEFDRVFDLYLKQNWGSEAERKIWREREALVLWPMPKF